jgi:hypothetical protein
LRLIFSALDQASEDQDLDHRHFGCTRLKATGRALGPSWLGPIGA